MVRVLAPATARTGVYEPRTRRFLPLTPARRGAVVALTARDMCPRLSDVGVELFSLDGSGTSVAKLEHRSKERSLGSCQVSIDRDGARLTLHDMSGAIGPLGFGVANWRITPGGTSGPHQGAAKVDGVAPMLEAITAAGVTVTRGAKGFYVKDGVLHAPDKSEIPLGRRDLRFIVPAVVVSPDGASAILAYATGDCDCAVGKQEGTPRHTMLRVDLRAKTVSVLGEGPGVGAAAFDDEGRLYVQEDRVLHVVDELAPAGAHTPDAPAGVLLVPGTIARYTCCSL